MMKGNSSLIVYGCLTVASLACAIMLHLELITVPLAVSDLFETNPTIEVVVFDNGISPGPNSSRTLLKITKQMCLLDWGTSKAGEGICKRLPYGRTEKGCEIYNACGRKLTRSLCVDLFDTAEEKAGDSTTTSKQTKSDDSVDHVCDEAGRAVGNNWHHLFLVPDNRLFVWSSYSIGKKTSLGHITCSAADTSHAHDAMAALRSLSLSSLDGLEVENSAKKNTTGTDGAGKAVILETLSLSPRVFRVSNFFTEEERDYLITSAVASQEPGSNIFNNGQNLKRSSTGSRGDIYSTSLILVNFGGLYL